MAATRAQKMRLGIFLVVTTVIAIAALSYLFGASILEVRDDYIVVLQGGSAGLEVGSQVRFNDIVVGRVERVRLDPEDPGKVIVALSVDHGTPITVDTIAVPEMANITGTKMLSLRGGTKESKRLSPGDTIKSTTSDLTMLTTKIVNISKKIEDLLDNLVVLTNSSNTESVGRALQQVEGITTNINGMLTENRENLLAIVTDARSIMGKVDSSLAKVDSALTTADSAVQRLASPQNVKMFTNMLYTANGLVNNVTNRTSEEELGQTIQSVNRLVGDVNVTVLRLRNDMQRIMRELEQGVENFNEFTQILVDNPSVLISGRSEKERVLP